ncbi:hypothetical protein GCM10011316_12440 [Roseibium aquae]|uniref:Uncharacterized protein n=1 Tax=Roseibium aquae TaxID=1323746 RepID=A0A916WZN4_9HYPH|nr:hypothetical protein [Roseibium aquae]GGB41972.1 hypothetical protein GCM10011316_12440 [Roseibium aquae]
MSLPVSGLSKAMLVVGLLMSLGACRESEENRPIKLDKGSYDGPADTGLSEEQRRQLQQRGTLQGF